MRVIIKDKSLEVAEWAARYIVSEIKAKAAKTDAPFVLGLPTGSTPLETYRELIRLYEAGEVSFKNVITFNMDEYVGLAEEHPESYHSFMWNNFFKYIDIKRENVHILNGNAEDLKAECEAYEAAIVGAGGIYRHSPLVLAQSSMPARCLSWLPVARRLAHCATPSRAATTISGHSRHCRFTPPASSFATMAQPRS